MLGSRFHTRCWHRAEPGQEAWSSQAHLAADLSKLPSPGPGVGRKEESRESVDGAALGADPGLSGPQSLQLLGGTINPRSLTSPIYSFIDMDTEHKHRSASWDEHQCRGPGRTELIDSQGLGSSWKCGADKLWTRPDQTMRSTCGWVTVYTFFAGDDLENKVRQSQLGAGVWAAGPGRFCTSWATSP